MATPAPQSLTELQANKPQGQPVYHIEWQLVVAGLQQIAVAFPQVQQAVTTLTQQLAALPTGLITQATLLDSLPLANVEALTPLGIGVDATDPANPKFTFNQTVFAALVATVAPATTTPTTPTTPSTTPTTPTTTLTALTEDPVAFTSQLPTRTGNSFVSPVGQNGVAWNKRAVKGTTCLIRVELPAGSSSLMLVPTLAAPGGLNDGDFIYHSATRDETNNQGVGQTAATVTMELRFAPNGADWRCQLVDVTGGQELGVRDIIYTSDRYLAAFFYDAAPGGPLNNIQYSNLV